MRAAAEAEQKVVGAEGFDVGVGLEAGLEGGEVDGAAVLVDLDGVAAAEGDVWASRAGEVGEDALAADLAAGAGRAGGDLGAFQGGVAGGSPEIEGEQGAAHELRLAGEELEGFGDLDGGGEIDGGGEDAGGVAGLDIAGGWGGKDAGETGGGRATFEVRGSRLELGEDVHGGGVGADSGGVDPGDGLLDGEVVEEVAGLEVVGGVQNDVSGGEEFGDVGGDEVGDAGVDGDGGVEALSLIHI